MAKKFNELRQKMSAERRRQNTIDQDLFTELESDDLKPSKVQQPSAACVKVTLAKVREAAKKEVRRHTALPSRKKWWQFWKR